MGGERGGAQGASVQPPLQAADSCGVLHKMSERFSLSKTLKNGSAAMCWHLTCCTHTHTHTSTQGV